MKTTITLEQAMQKASPSLREKIAHSVELCRKAEAIALKYDPDKGFACGFSGGKDSQAAYHILQLAGVKFWAQFSPTSVDPPEVVRFIKEQYPEVEIRKLTTNIYREAVKIGCLPTMRIRWCCAVFKENAFPNKVTVVGVRKAESARRAKRNEVEVTSHKFSGDLDAFDAWSEKQRQRLGKKIKNLNQDQFAEPQGETSIRCVGGKDSIIVMPILHWSDDDVWEFLNNVIEAPHCSLYDEGRKRIGCIMCPFAGRKSTMADIKRWPHVYWKWVDAVRRLREEKEMYKTSEIGQIAGRLYPPPGEYAQWHEWLVEKGGYSKPNGKYAITPPQLTRTDCEPSNKFAPRSDQYNRMGTARRRTQQQIRAAENSISTPNGGRFTNPFLPSPTGEGYVNTPEEMIIHWWISKLSFKEWYAKYIQQQRFDF